MTTQSTRTTQQESEDLRHADGRLGDLFDRSPALAARTAVPAEIAFVSGLVALLVSPFSLTLGLTIVLAGLAVLTSIAGLARASRPGIAGGVLAGGGLVLALGAGTVVGLRYAGLDTAVGDSLVAQLGDALRWLNDLFPPV